jgi:hypothetical protein
MEGVSYERNPYRNHKLLSGQSGHVSRFVALATVGNKEKQKYLYAFNMAPMKYIDREELHKQAADTTECPYKMTHQEVMEMRESGAAPHRNEFFYGQSSAAGNKRHGNLTVTLSISILVLVAEKSTIIDIDDIEMYLFIISSRRSPRLYA